jgi:hypothetical protein
MLSEPEAAGREGASEVEGDPEGEVNIFAAVICSLAVGGVH